MSNSKHTSRQFDTELEAAHERVLLMGGLVESQIRLTLEALVGNDSTLASRVITDDHRVNALERIGDEAKKIAYMARDLSQREHTHLPRYTEIRHSAKLVLDMLHKSLDSFARLDLSTVAQVVLEDELVDKEFRAILRYLVTFMMEDPRTISNSLEILFIAKAIERMGDHAQNMAKYMVYMVKGRDARHISVEEIEREVQEGTAP